MTMWGQMTRDERVEAIRSGVARLLSARQISEEIGAASRSVVQGFARRNKVVLLPPAQSRRPKRPGRVIIKAPHAVGKVAFVTRPHFQCSYPCWPDKIDMRATDVTSLMVCGDPVKTPGQSYCAAHYALCWQPAKARQKVLEAA